MLTLESWKLAEQFGNTVLDQANTRPMGYLLTISAAYNSEGEEFTEIDKLDNLTYLCRISRDMPNGTIEEKCGRALITISKWHAINLLLKLCQI